MNHTSSLRTVAIGLIVGLGTLSCAPDDFQKLDKRNWELVWSDEFNGAVGTLPDPAKWGFDIGTGQDGWGNQELQYYTNRPENVSHDGNGNLVITARREAFGGRAFTSARINTKGKFSQTYGRIEARIQNPYGPGVWPAFWMLGDAIDTVGWPQCGEIDIMEMRGQEPSLIHGSLHGPGYSAGNPISGSHAFVGGRYDADFHIFAVEWFEDRIDFFVDGYLYNRVRPRDANGEWVFNSDMFLILNVAVGGAFVGFPNDLTPFPQQMVIDYVRVYR